MCRYRFHVVQEYVEIKLPKEIDHISTHRQCYNLTFFKLSFNLMC
jgi:hypothetical protein